MAEMKLVILFYGVLNTLLVCIYLLMSLRKIRGWGGIQMSLSLSFICLRIHCYCVLQRCRSVIKIFFKKSFVTGDFRSPAYSSASQISVCLGFTKMRVSLQHIWDDTPKATFLTSSQGPMQQRSGPPG